METQAEIFEQLQSILEEEFELDKSDIQLKTHMYLDLDLDSIDAVDLVIRLQEITGKTINPEKFKAVRTIEDVVNVVFELVNS